MRNELIGKLPDEMTIIIENREIIFTEARLMRSLDTVADSCTVTMPWEPGIDDEIDRLTSPYGYKNCFIYLGNNLQMQGILYNVTHRRNKEGTIKELEIYSKTADIIDSTVVPPYEANNISLTDRCKQQVNRFGIDVVVGDGVNLLKPRRILLKRFQPAIVDIFILSEAKYNNQYKPSVNTFGTWKVTGTKTIIEEQRFLRVTAKQTDKIFDHLKKLSAQRGLLLSCTKWGDLLITKANTEDAPIGTLWEENPLTNAYESHFNGRNRYNVYRALASSSSSSRAKYANIVQDPAIKVPRVLTFNVSNNMPGEANKAAAWKKNKSFADALTIKFPVNSWYSSDEQLWIPNTKVTVISPTIGIKKGFTFLISQVEYESGQNGSIANLQLKPPTAYTTGEIIEPWLEESDE